MDLGAFHLMSSSTASSIANELMGYWLLLTEGRYYPLRMMVMMMAIMMNDDDDDDNDSECTSPSPS